MRHDVRNHVNRAERIPDWRFGDYTLCSHAFHAHLRRLTGHLLVKQLDEILALARAPPVGEVDDGIDVGHPSLAALRVLPNIKIA